MKIRFDLRRLTYFALAAAMIAVPAEAGSIVAAVDATNPLGFWTLSSLNSPSEVNGYTSTYENGAGESAAGTGFPENQAVSLNGVDNNGTPQYVQTSLSGGIDGAGSMMAWVNLAELPSTAGAFFYVSGESEGGNDFDLQFQNDNNLYFYTGSGENTEYVVSDPSSLVNQWNMIAVTYTGGVTGSRDIYWDGTLVASFSGATDADDKVNQFSIGYSDAFGGRDFDGSIDDVAVWNTAITQDQVTSIWDASSAVSAVPEPGTLGLFGAGLLAVGLLRRRFRS